MATKDQIIEVAKELNRVMGLDPLIKVSGTKTEIEEDVLEAAAMLKVKDPVSLKSQKVLKEIGFSLKEWGEPAPEPEKKDPPASTKKDEPPAKKKMPATTRIVQLVCEDPSVTADDIKKKLAEEGITPSDSTISMQMTDTMKAINCLKEQDKLRPVFAKLV